jgi:hypothetical protein
MKTDNQEAKERIAAKMHRLLRIHKSALQPARSNGQAFKSVETNQESRKA